MGDLGRNEKMRTGAPTRVTTWVLAAVVVAQLVLLGWSQWPGVLRAAQFQGLPATERSARIAFGDRFGDFIVFVSINVPVARRVVIPPMQTDSAFGDVGLMQYFLFPREIVNCPSGPDLASCVRSLTGAQTCILRIGDFPAPEDVPPSKGYLPFDAERGLYCPQ